MKEGAGSTDIGKGEGTAPLRRVSTPHFRSRESHADPVRQGFPGPLYKELERGGNLTGARQSCRSHAMAQVTPSPSHSPLYSTLRGRLHSPLLAQRTPPSNGALS